MVAGKRRAATQLCRLLGQRRGQEAQKDDDTVQTFTHELRYPATTESARLATEMAKRHDAQHMSVVFSTYHSTRNLARREGELYVVTGPLFEGESLQRINGRVLVPTSVFKAIYSPQQQAAAYVTPNAPGMAYLTLSIADPEKRAHITVFPTLPQRIKEPKMPLPVPTPHSSRGRPQQTRRSRTDHKVTPCKPFNPSAATPHLSRLAT
jgi:hypothetical protein